MIGLTYIKMKYYPDPSLDLERFGFHKEAHKRIKKNRGEKDPCFQLYFHSLPTKVKWCLFKVKLVEVCFPGNLIRTFT